MRLPDPEVRGKMSVEEAIRERGSERTFVDKPLALKQLSQILWSAQGTTEGERKAAPSAGATYPMDLYAVVGRVEGIEAGLYHYTTRDHKIELLQREDLRSRLSEVSLFQAFIADAPVSIVITAEYERTTARYGERGIRYVHMEAGHISQNIYLQAKALGLGTVAVGAFRDEEVSGVLNLPERRRPLYVMPIGYTG